MLASEKALLAALFRDNPSAISDYLTDIFEKNDFEAAIKALSLIMQAQNVQMLSRDAGLRRDTLYRTFGGRVDPSLSRILKLYEALNVHARVAPMFLSDSQSEPKTMVPTLRDSSESIANHLTRGFDGNAFEAAVFALKEAAFAQNVTHLARASGIQRRTIYKTFGGKVDPQLSRILKIFTAMKVRFVVVALPHKVRPPRPKLGRPPRLRPAYAEGDDRDDLRAEPRFAASGKSREKARGKSRD